MTECSGEEGECFTVQIEYNTAIVWRLIKSQRGCRRTAVECKVNTGETVDSHKQLTMVKPMRDPPLCDLNLLTRTEEATVQVLVL